MWPQTFHTVAHWPWSTIAAFAAVGVTMTIARSQTGERAQLLGRQTVVDVAATSGKWATEMAKFRGITFRRLSGKAAPNELDEDAINSQILAATNDMMRVLQLARMTCNDFEMQRSVAAAEFAMVSFLAQIARPATESKHEQSARLKQNFEAGEAIAAQFGRATDAFVQRGYAVYSPRRDRRFKHAERQWNRQLKADTQTGE